VGNAHLNFIFGQVGQYDNTRPAWVVLQVVVPPTTVSSIALTSATGIQNSALNAGDVVTATVYMSEGTTVTGTPTLALVVGSTTVQATYVSGSGSTGLVFSYTILAGQTDANGISIGFNSLALNGGTLKSAAGSAAVLTHAAVADNPGYMVDTTFPITTPTPKITGATGIQNSTLNAGDVLSVTVPMSEPTWVTGTPTIGLTIGASSVLASYVSGSGTKALVFSYTILGGQTDTDGISINSNSLALSGGTLLDAAGNTARTTLMAATNNDSYKVDTAAPTQTVGSVVGISADTGTSTTDFLTSTAGQTITGTLSGALAVGDILYGSVNNGTSWTDITSKVSGTAISWDGATLSGSSTIVFKVADAAGNTTGLTSGSQAYVLDTVAPTLAITSNVSAVKAGQTATITFTFSEDPGSTFVWDGSAGDVVVTGGTLGAISGTGLTRSATFTPTASLASGNASITVASASYTDAAGNSGGAGTTPAISIDTLAPTLAITSNVSAVKAGQTATITFTFSEDPGSTFAWDGSAGDVVVTGGTLGAISGSGLTRSATFTPTASLASANASITVASASYTDAAGNSGGAGTTPAISIDTTVPTVSSVAISSATGLQSSTLNAGDVLSTTVTMSEATTVVTSGGTPTLALNIGGTLVQANYGSGSGSTALVFNYTILAGQTDATGISVAADSLALNGGTLADAAGNTAALTHSAVADNTGYLVDTTVPTATNTSAAYAASTNTLVLTGTNYNTLLESSETASTDIKGRLDWSKLSWDINGDNATTADVAFSLGDITSAVVTDATHLTIVLASAKGTSLEATAGFNATGGADTLDIAAGFAKDTAGNAATTDAVANAALAITATPVAGDAVIDLGAYGKLIAPVQVNGGQWYYYWDRSGDGSSANTGGLNGGADGTTHDVLDALFNHDINGNTNTITQNADLYYGTTETYRYATINGVSLALPAYGWNTNGLDTNVSSDIQMSNTTPFASSGSSAAGNATPSLGGNVHGYYDGLLAIWDAYNGIAAGQGVSSGVPPGWASDTYWSATATLNSGTKTWADHALLGLNTGYIYGYADTTTYYVALRVL
jgi:hypothetical protein